MTEQAAPIPETPPKLEPCPFCRAPGELGGFISSWYCRCSSEDCWASSHGSLYMTEGDAITAWNTRATPTVNARAAAEEIVSWFGAESEDALGVAGIIAKHFATPAQPAPAEGKCHVCGGLGHTGVAYTLQTEGYQRDEERKRAAEMQRVACWSCGGSGQAAQGDRAGLTAQDRRVMFDAVGMLSERYPLTAKDLRGIIRRLTGAKP